MTALGKLFRATAFKLTLAILGSAPSARARAWRRRLEVIKLVDDETAQTIEAEAKGLADSNTAGRHRLGAVIEARSARAGLVALPADEPPASRSPAMSAHPRRRAVDRPVSSTDLLPAARRASAEAGRALAESSSLPGGFRLLVGHDLGDRARIGAVMVRALAMSLIFFAALARSARCSSPGACCTASTR